MTDQNTEQIFNAIKSRCANGGYAVISAEEIATDTGCSETVVCRAVDSLARAGNISLRFSEGGEFCLSVLKEDCRIAKNLKQGDNARKRRVIMFLLLSFLGAFLGGMIGGALVGALF